MGYNRNHDGPSAEDRALDRIAEVIIERLKDIQADWKKPWFDSGTGMLWPRSINGRDYSGINAMALMLHSQKMGYTMPYWATFNKLSGMNFSKGSDGSFAPMVDTEGHELPRVMVNKGEKSFPVFLTTFTCVHKETKEKLPYDEYKRLTDEQKKDYNVYPKLQVYNVFSLEQTNLREARPDLWASLEAKANIGRVAEGGERDMFRFEPVEAMIKHQAWFCPIILGGNDAYYSLSKDEVHVPEQKAFKNGEAFIGTMLHECAHSLGATGRLNRLGDGEAFGSDKYSAEELVAEMTSALVCSRYGIDKNIKEDSMPYLKSWLDHLHEGPAFIKTIMGDIKRGSFVMIDRLDDIQEKLDYQRAHPGETVDFKSYESPLSNVEFKPFETAKETETVPFRLTR